MDSRRALQRNVKRRATWLPDTQAGLLGQQICKRVHSGPAPMLKSSVLSPPDMVWPAQNLAQVICWRMAGTVHDCTGRGFRIHMRLPHGLLNRIPPAFFIKPIALDYRLQPTCWKVQAMISNPRMVAKTISVSKGSIGQTTYRCRYQHLRLPVHPLFPSTSRITCKQFPWLL